MRASAQATRHARVPPCHPAFATLAFTPKRCERFRGGGRGTGVKGWEAKVEASRWESNRCEHAPKCATSSSADACVA